MLEIAESHGFHFDTLQMPLNVMDAHFRSFEKEVLPVANRRGIGVLGMKTFGFGPIATLNIAQPVELLHYSMSLPVSVVITGMDSMPRLDQALFAARTFKPMTPDQVAGLLARTRDLAMDGKYEQFKVSPKFDGTTHAPQWLA